MKKFSIKAKAFRSFRDEVELEIRPLTLLYGFNQAGKSTLLRLISLLAASLQSDAGPLDLSCPASGGMSFKELGWLGRNPILSPKISIDASDTESMPSVKIQFTNDSGLIVNHINISSGSNKIFFAYYEEIISRSKKEIKAVYVGNHVGKEWKGELRFNSMLPEGLPEHVKEIVHNIDDAIKPLKRLQWLQANRLPSQKSSDKISLCCSADGSDLPVILNTQNGYEVVKKTSDWLRTQEGLGNGISIRQDSEGRLNFVHEADGREQLPLFLSGEGLRSLLPVILCACWAEKGGASAPSMLAVEEIEAHLHPPLYRLLSLTGWSQQSAQEFLLFWRHIQFIFFVRCSLLFLRGDCLLMMSVCIGLSRQKTAHLPLIGLKSKKMRRLPGGGLIFSKKSRSLHKRFLISAGRGAEEDDYLAARLSFLRKQAG